MKLLKFVVVFVISIFFITMAVLANSNSNNFSNGEIFIQDGLKSFQKKICVDNLGNKTCIENTYIQCNGQTYNVPKPTSYTVYNKIYVKEYVEIEPNVKENLNGQEKPSPLDRIKDSDLDILNNEVVISIKNAKWRKFIDSNSMDPLIDEGTTTIETKPKSPEEVKIGDIISFKVEGYDYAFVHRVVRIENDDSGIYFATKGDNYWKEDPYKVRFSQIEGIVVGILY